MRRAAAGLTQAQGPDGVYRLVWPIPADVKIPSVSAGADTGRWVAEIIKRRATLLGGRVPAAAGWWSGRDIVDTFKEITGKPAEYLQIDGEVWKGEMVKSGMTEKVAHEILESSIHTVQGLQVFWNRQPGARR